MALTRVHRASSACRMAYRNSKRASLSIRRTCADSLNKSFQVRRRKTRLRWVNQRRKTVALSSLFLLNLHLLDIYNQSHGQYLNVSRFYICFILCSPFGIIIVVDKYSNVYKRRPSYAGNSTLESRSGIVFGGLPLALVHVCDDHSLSATITVELVVQVVYEAVVYCIVKVNVLGTFCFTSLSGRRTRY
jgi:hypothetical protein